jgi:predicted O-methyltransferase YrrM
MGNVIEVWPSGWSARGDSLVASARVELAKGGNCDLWYRVPATHKTDLAQSSDHFLLGTIFLAMQNQADLVIHGTVSPSLLRNLEEFQKAWECWLPQRYKKIEVSAEKEKEESVSHAGNDAVAAFSGGVDSIFTVFRHRTGSCGRLRRDIRLGVMVHGFDIPLNQPQVFDRALRRSALLLDSVGVETVAVTTNFRDLGLSWEDCYGAALASCLVLFQGHFSCGLKGSGEPYQSLVLPWASNPVTDYLLSTGSFQIIHDGAGFTRTEKVRDIACWPEAMKLLRVCWQGQQLDRNCGSCEKCVRTILNFRVNGLALPECFEHDVTDKQILTLRKLNPTQLGELRQILSAARKAAMTASWVSALEQCIKQNERRESFAQRLVKEATGKVKRAMPRRIRSVCRSYLNARAPLPRDGVHVLQGEREEVDSLVRRILGAANARTCKRITAAIERDKTSTVRALGAAPADPKPLSSTRYKTEAEALIGCATPERGGKLFFGLTRALRPRVVVEIGAAHGYGALYIGSALRHNHAGKLFTLEGMSARVRLSKAAIERFRLGPYVDLVDGNFDQTLRAVLTRTKPIDLVFSDGDKNPRRTKEQFLLTLESMSEGGYILFDDVNFDRELQEVWAWIVTHERIRSCIVFYSRWGLVEIGPEPREIDACRDHSDPTRDARFHDEAPFQ